MHPEICHEIDGENSCLKIHRGGILKMQRQRDVAGEIDRVG